MPRIKFKKPSMRITATYLLLLFWLSLANTQAAEFEVTVSKPTFVLPQFTGAFSEREASIAPEEYEIAERLRTMLDNNQRDEVLRELETFYDIELSAAMIVLKAQIYFSLNMYDKAEATYLAVLTRKPQLVRAHSDLAQLYLLQENYTKARTYFANAVSFGSNEALIHGQLAYLNLTLYGPFSAISEYQQAMALEPDNVQWQQGLLAALTQAKMYEAAEALLQELLAKRPNAANLWLNQAALALHQNEFQQALTSLEMAILLGDDDPKNLKTAAQLHLQLNSYDRALALLDKSLEGAALNMESISEYFRWLSQLEMWQRADKLLDSVAGRVSSMSSADRSHFYLHRAQVAAKRENNAEARKNFQQALENNPVNGHALLQYAEFLSSQRSYIDAELLYVRAEAVAGSEKNALLGRAQLYIDMQDYPSALNHLKATYQKFPEMIEIKNNIEILENIIRVNQSKAI